LIAQAFALVKQAIGMKQSMENLAIKRLGANYTYQ
jgi:hypothetical protein